MKHTPPPDLTLEGRQFWQTIAKDYGLSDIASLSILSEAARARDRCRQARELLEKDGLCQNDRFGQSRPHPATKIEIDSRASFLRCVAALGLDLSGVTDHA